MDEFLPAWSSSAVQELALPRCRDLLVKQVSMLRTGIVTLDQCNTVECVSWAGFAGSEQAGVHSSYFMPCGFDELFTIHPAYLWARETLILVLKL